MKNYFEVEAKCGHVGINNCVRIKFAVWAENGKQAAAKARNFPRVKHHHKDAIISVKSIGFEEYIILKAKNDVDPFLHCKNIQEQRSFTEIIDRIEADYYTEKRMYKKKKCVEYKRKKTAIKVATAIKEIMMGWAV